MNEFLEFARGPLFRFSFGVLCLGLLRLIILTVINGLEAKSKAVDKRLPMQYVNKLTWGFVLPIRAFRVRPIFAIVSIVFHMGLLITPIFLFDHSLLFERSVGFSLINFSLSKSVADVLAVITVIAALGLLLIRVINKNSRFISRKQDFLWLILLIIPFITGIVCAQFTISGETYNYFMLMHILSGCLIFILIPFTKIAHCVLLPFGQWITARVWKFQPNAGEDVWVTLGKQGEKL